MRILLVASVSRHQVGVAGVVLHQQHVNRLGHWGSSVHVRNHRLWPGPCGAATAGTYFAASLAAQRPAGLRPRSSRASCAADSSARPREARGGDAEPHDGSAQRLPQAAREARRLARPLQHPAGGRRSHRHRSAGQHPAGVADACALPPRAQDALRMARQSVPDLVLLDIEMPGMSGFEVCAAMKETPLLMDVPIIFITSHDDPEHEVAGLALGASDFIVKPPRPAQVVARVRMHLRMKQLADALAQRGLPGRPDRHRQPAPVRRDDAARVAACPARGLAHGAADDRHRRLQEATTTTTATRRATAACRPWRRPSSRPCTARPTWRPATAARNSPCCCPTPTACGARFLACTCCRRWTR
jgi:DNA-binding response OmpR family regulator